MRRLFAALAALLAIGFASPAFACGIEGCTCEEAKQGDEAEEESDSEDLEATAELEVRVDGMSCGKCANHLASTLRSTEGVVEAEVSFGDKKATIQYDAESVDAESVVETIEEAHSGKFDVEILSQSAVTS